MTFCSSSGLALMNGCLKSTLYEVGLYRNSGYLNLGELIDELMMMGD